MEYYVMPDGTVVFTKQEAQDYDNSDYTESGE